MPRVDIEIVAKDNTGPAFKAVEQNMANVGRTASQSMAVTNQAVQALLPPITGLGASIRMVAFDVLQMDTASRGMVMAMMQIAQVAAAGIPAMNGFAAAVLRVTLAIGAVPAPVWLAIAALAALTAVVILSGVNLNTFFSSVGTQMSSFFTGVRTKLSTEGMAIVSWLSAFGASVNNFVRQLMGSILGYITGLIGQVFQAGVNIMVGFLQGLMSMAGAILDFVANLVKSIITSITSALQIRSPSKVMENLGKNTMLGFDKGLRSFDTAGLMPGITVGGNVVRRGGGGSMGGGPIIVNLTYSPAVSLASQSEVQNVLLPYIRKGVNMVNSGR